MDAPSSSPAPTPADASNEALFSADIEIAVVTLLALFSLACIVHKCCWTSCRRKKSTAYSLKKSVGDSDRSLESGTPASAPSVDLVKQNTKSEVVEISLSSTGDGRAPSESSSGSSSSVHSPPDLHTETKSDETPTHVRDSSDTSERHLEEEHELEAGEKQFFCHFDNCKEGFTRKDNMKTHIKNKHSGRPDRFQCEVCEDDFATKWNLKTHMNTHTLDKPHRCPHCPTSFAQSSQLTAHVEKVHDFPFKCPKARCRHRFSSESKCRDHFEQEHPGEVFKKPRPSGRTHRCSACKTTFKTSIERTAHEQTCSKKVDISKYSSSSSSSITSSFSTSSLGGSFSANKLEDIKEEGAPLSGNGSEDEQALSVLPEASSVSLSTGLVGIGAGLSSPDRGDKRDDDVRMSTSGSLAAVSLHCQTCGSMREYSFHVFQRGHKLMSVLTCKSCNGTFESEYNPQGLPRSAKPGLLNRVKMRFSGAWHPRRQRAESASASDSYDLRVTHTRDGSTGQSPIPHDQYAYDGSRVAKAPSFHQTPAALSSSLVHASQVVSTAKKGSLAGGSLSVISTASSPTSSPAPPMYQSSSNMHTVSMTQSSSNMRTTSLTLPQCPAYQSTSSIQYNAQSPTNPRPPTATHGLGAPMQQPPSPSSQLPSPQNVEHQVPDKRLRFEEKSQSASALVSRALSSSAEESVAAHLRVGRLPEKRVDADPFEQHYPEHVALQEGVRSEAQILSRRASLGEESMSGASEDGRLSGDERDDINSLDAGIRAFHSSRVPEEFSQSELALSPSFDPILDASENSANMNQFDAAFSELQV